MIQEYFHYIMDDFDNGSFIFCSISQPIPFFSMNAMKFERHLSGSMMNAFQPIQKESMLFFFLYSTTVSNCINYPHILFPLLNVILQGSSFYFWLPVTLIFLFFFNLFSEVFFDCCIGQILFLFGRFLLGLHFFCLHFFCLPLCFVDYY